MQKKEYDSLIWIKLVLYKQLLIMSAHARDNCGKVEEEEEKDEVEEEVEVEE